MIQQAPESATRGAWRGSGFELRTDGWLAIRAGEGILISATARPNAQSTQMDVAESVSQLKAAQQTAQALSDAAQRQHALPLKANPAQTAFLQAIDPQQDGHHNGSIGGQAAQKAQPGSRNLGDPAERFAQPFILNEAPADIGFSSPASTLLFAGANLHATVQQDFHIASAYTLSTAVGGSASWFSHSGGIKSIAQAGSHTIQANTDALEILADQSVTVTSSNDEIHILAKEKIVLQAGQSSVTLDGQNITFACPGTFSVKGAGHAFLGAASNSANLEGLPSAQVNLPLMQEYGIQLDAGSFFTNDPALEVASYEIWSRDESPLLLESGTLQANGRSSLAQTPSKQMVDIVIGENEWFDIEEIQVAEDRV